MHNLIKSLSPYLGVTSTAFIQQSIPGTEFLAPILGSAIQSNLEFLGDEIQKRNLTRVERERVTECFGFALDKIIQRLNRNEKLRPDIGAFFTSEMDDYSPGDKLLESAFINSRNESEKKKIQFIGNLIANLLFSNHNFEQSYYLLKTAENLTWRQFCQISLVSGKANVRVEEKPYPNYPEKITSIDYRLEMYELVSCQV